jgi:hypothetical protein
VLNKFLLEQQEKLTLDQDTKPAIESVDPDLVADSIKPLALNQYVDFDLECSGLFSNCEIEGAKRLTKDG